jgi:serine O-acetyltransferase
MSARAETTPLPWKERTEGSGTPGGLGRLRGIFDGIAEDLRVVMERDPAARNWLEIVLLYPGLHAIWAHRLAHWLWTHRLLLLGRWVSQVARALTGVEIHPGAVVGRGFFIDHGMGIVIGETTEIGRNCSLYQGVTLGGVTFRKGKRHPTLEDNVVVGAGAKILGDIVIGAGSRIGANAVVVKDVPADSVVVGVPGQVLVRSRPRPAVPDLNHNVLPDTIGTALASVMERLETVESQLHIHVQEHPGPNGEAEPVLHHPDHEIWRGEDFMI